MSSVHAANNLPQGPPIIVSLPQASKTSPTNTVTHPEIQAASSPTREHSQDPTHVSEGFDGRSSDPEKMFDSSLAPGSTLTSVVEGALSTNEEESSSAMIMNGNENSGTHINDATSSLDQSQNASMAVAGNVDDQQWNEEDSHELKRVKVYELIGARWVDQGTAFCFGDFQDNEALLIARAEADFNQVILTTTIRSSDVYQRQQGEPLSIFSMSQVMRDVPGFQILSLCGRSLMGWITR